MVQKALIFGCLLTLLAVTGCTPRLAQVVESTPTAAIAGEPQDPAPNLTTTRKTVPAANTPTSTSSPTVQPSPDMEPTVIRRPTSRLPNFTPTPILATHTPPPVVCTPLAEHTFTDLLEIVTQPFAPPAPGKDDGHHGVDFAYYRRGERLSIAGVPVQTALAGRVAATSSGFNPYGNMVMVETPFASLPPGLAERLGILTSDSLYLLYAHMEAEPAVRLGDALACGQTLGTVGNTPEGWSSNPHLHLEARRGPPGTVFESLMYYDNRGTLDGMENYRLWRMSGTFEVIDPLLLVGFALETGTSD